MTAPDSFIDSNVLLYLLSANSAKADRAEHTLRGGGLISVQVLNEIANVARRKLAMPWGDVNEFLSLVRAICPVVPLTVEIHDKGRDVAEHYKLSVYDSMIVAAALTAGCKILYSEDMHAGTVIDGQLRVSNPFC